MRWWQDGQPAGGVAFDDRGLAYGDGVFETVAIRNGAPRFFGHHLERLALACERLRLTPPPPGSITTAVTAALAGVRHGVLKILYTRGAGPRGYAPPSAPVPTLAIGVEATDPEPSPAIDICWCASLVSVNPATAGIKTLGRLDQVLARAEWSPAEFGEGLMANTEGRLAGGTASNVFMVAGDRLVTPLVGRAGVAGVMRRVVLEAARDAGLEVAEADLAPSEVATASEVFLTNALTGIRPVRRLGSRTWITGPVTRLLRGKLADAGVTECAG